MSLIYYKDFLNFSHSNRDKWLNTEHIKTHKFEPEWYSLGNSGTYRNVIKLSSHLTSTRILSYEINLYTHVHKILN